MATGGTPRCVVPGCDSLFMTSQPGPYYMLRGREYDLLVDWLRACKYPEQDIERQIKDASNNDVLCASHFIGKTFRNDVANQRVPSVFPWSPTEMSRRQELDVDDIVSKGCPLETPSSVPNSQGKRQLSASARNLYNLIAQKRSHFVESVKCDSPVPSKVAKESVSETTESTKSTSIGSRCIVPYCDGYFRGENRAPNFKPKYFTLPFKDDQLLQEWLMAIGLTAKSNLSAGKICCTHFKDGLFSTADPLHRMPIVFAPRQEPPKQSEESSKTGLKPNVKPHFARKPVPLSEQGNKGVSEATDEDSETTEYSSNQDDASTSGASLMSSTSSSSSSAEPVSMMPKLHSAAVTSGLRTQRLSVLTPEQLCTMIIENHSKIGCCQAPGVQLTEDEEWRALVDCDLPQTKSFGFGRFLFSLGLNVVRRRVYRTALAASERIEKRNKGTALSQRCKGNLTKALECFEGELAVDRLDNFITRSPLGVQQCRRCSFKTESRLILDWHRRQPHFDRTKHGYVFCCLCPDDQLSMKITLYREHLRFAHGCSFVAFDLFSQPYLCHYCTVCCSSWQVLLSHMNNCRLTFNVHDNLRPDPKTDVTLAVTAARPPAHIVIDNHLHASNEIYQALADLAAEIGLRQQFAAPAESASFADLSNFYGLQPIVDSRALAPLGFDSTNQEFASFFGNLPPVQTQCRTTLLHVPQSTAIVQIIQPAAPKQPVVMSQRPVVTAPKPLQPTTSRFAFAPPSELPSSFRPIAVAKLPEITMATIEAASAASRPPPTMHSGSATVKPGLIDPLPPSVTPGIRDVPSNSVIKRPQPPFTGANNYVSTTKRFRQTEFTLTTMQRLLFCEICHGIVQEREALRIHLFWAHRIGLPPSAMITDEWYTACCHSCGLGFYTPDGLERHSAVGCFADIFVPTFCVVCHKFLSTSSLLCAHLAREHGLTPPSMTRARVCFICSSAFDTEDHTAQHLLLGHRVTTEPNAERPDFINVIWQGQLVASVDPNAIGAEAAAAMLSLQAAAAFAANDDDGMLIEKFDSEAMPSGGLGAVGEQNRGISSTNRALFFAARGGVAAPFRRGPGRPPLRGPGRPRGSRARGPMRPRGSRGPYRPRGTRGMPGSRGPGRPPASNSSSKRAAPKRRAPRDFGAAGKAQWFHEEFSLSETDESDMDPNQQVMEPDEPEVDYYDEGDYGGYYNDDYNSKSHHSASRRQGRYF